MGSHCHQAFQTSTRILTRNRIGPDRSETAYEGGFRNVRFRAPDSPDPSGRSAERTRLMRFHQKIGFVWMGPYKANTRSPRRGDSAVRLTPLSANGSWMPGLIYQSQLWSKLSRRQGKARQLYLCSTFHTQGRLKVLHI